MGSDDVAAGPLDEAWWLRDTEKDFPPDDAPILAAYQKTRPGFELVVAKTLYCRQDLDCFPAGDDGHQRICLWNIWEQKGDPADADAEKQRINDMQRALGELTEDDRYIRLQIACFERCFWTFPGNVELILDGIRKGRVNLDAGISCEPPWMNSILPLLRRRRGHAMATSDASADVSRRTLIRDYATILSWWTMQGDLERLKASLPDSAEVAERLYRYLGPPTALKCLYAERLRVSLDFWGVPSTAGHVERWQTMTELTAPIDAAIRARLGDEKDVAGPLIDANNENGFCHHAFFRHVERIIACIGAGKRVTLPGSGQERKRIHEAVTNYIHALASWLAGRTPQEAASIWPPSKETARRVYELLGDVTPRKRWLAACLWKKLQENQARHGRGALDEEPERFALPAEALTA
jgi:hypothetical protein